jgi:hypothetical protein
VPEMWWPELCLITFKRFCITVKAQQKRAPLWGFHLSGIFLSILILI